MAPTTKPFAPTTRHGTVNAYNNFKCRCDDCCAALTADRASKKQALPRPDPVGPLPPLGPTEWITQARCAALPSERWFSHDPQDVAYAKLICGQCTVRQVCLQRALLEEQGSPHRFGVRGGLSPQERA